LAQKNGPAAAAEFQKLVDHQGIVQNFLLGSLAHLQLGRAYATSGDAAQSQNRLSGFPHPLERCRPRRPNPEEAKAEYAKLR
jgi:eukaryotic-like serine/threonine-protein kinase